MLDFTQMEYGVIRSKDGLIAIVSGKFYGPFNKKQWEKVIELLEDTDATTRNNR
jgi:hypothetical protein